MTQDLTAPSPQTGSTLSAVLLVAGTCIGGGMLALPVGTGVSGFFPSMLMMIICWFAMTVTALLLLEVSLWLDEGAHIITMTSRFLGKWGKAISWVLYLFICYASLVAYTAGGGLQITHFLEHVSGWTITKAAGCTLFVIVFGILIDLGTHLVGRINALLFGGMIAAYVGIVAAGMSEVKIENLLHSHWPTTTLAIPLLLTSFSFQTMVPSLTPYLKRNPQALRYSVIIGTTIALIVYAVWEWLVLGIIPVRGDNGLLTALAKGEPATSFIRAATSMTWIALVAEFFAFFALVTSFLGIGMGLLDFLSDGLKIPNQGKGKAFLGLLIAVPTLFFAVFFERAFLVALDASGGYGDSILNGIIPVLMVWIGRYHYKMNSQFRVPGGKPLLIGVLLFFVFALCTTILVHTGHLLSIYDVREVDLIRAETAA